MRSQPWAEVYTNRSGRRRDFRKASDGVLPGRTMKPIPPIAQPCAEGVIIASPSLAPCSSTAAPWILAATIIGSSLAFIDGSVVNLVLPALQTTLNATVVDVQWIVEAYALLLRL